MNRLSAFLLYLFLACLVYSCGESETTAQEESATEPIEKPEGPRLRAAINYLRVRTEPSAEAKVVEVLKANETVFSFDEESENRSQIELRGRMYDTTWVKVQTIKGNVGWAYAGALEIVPDRQGPAVNAREARRNALPDEDLKRLSRMLDEFPPDDPDAISKASEILRQSFGTAQEPEHVDEAIALFLEFYKARITRQNELLPKNSAYLEIIGFNHDVVPQYTQETQSQFDRWKANGMRIAFAEGEPYLEEVPDYLRQQFSRIASPAMTKYLVQRARELKKPVASDGGLTVTPMTLAKWCIFRDQLLKEFPNFRLKSELNGNYRSYLSFLMGGLDNTPAFDFESDSLLPDFREALTWVRSTHPNTPTGGHVIGYWQVLQRAGFRRTEVTEQFVANLMRDLR